MPILTLTLILAFVNLVMVVHAVAEQGWTNLYLIPLAATLVAVVLGVVGYLA